MWSWIIYALLSAWSSAFATIFAKMAIKTTHPLATAAIETSIASMFLIIGMLFYRRVDEQIILPFEFYNIVLILAAGIATGLGWIFYLTALRYGSIAQVLGIDRLSIVFTIFLGIIMLKEGMELKYLIGSLLIFFGAYIMI